MLLFLLDVHHGHTHARTHAHARMHTHTHTHTALTPLERLIADTAEYCRERKAFGRPILDNQVVHYRLAELETEVEALRSLLYRAIGEPHPVCTLLILSGKNKATQSEKPSLVPRPRPDFISQPWRN